MSYLLIAMFPVLLVVAYTTVKLLTNLSDLRTNRLVYVNQAWSQAVAQDLYLGVQMTLKQEKKELESLYNEIGISPNWSAKEIDAFEASL